MRTICLLLAMGMAMPAWGQGLYDGTWSVSIDSDRRANLTGTAVIAGDGGSWHVLVKSKQDPCLGKEPPLKVIKANKKILVLKIMRSEALRGCSDVPLKLIPGAEGMLEGHFNSGDRVTFTRVP